MEGLRILASSALFLAASALPGFASGASPVDPTWSVVPTGPYDCRPDRCPVRAGAQSPTSSGAVRRAMSLARWWTESPRSALTLVATTDAAFEPFGKRVRSERAARQNPDMGPIFWIDAVDAELRRPEPDRDWLARVRSSGALNSPVEGSAGARLGIEIVLTDGISVETAKSSLAGPDRESACEVVEEFLKTRSDATNASGLANLHHGHCSGVDVASVAVARNEEPSVEMRILRAERLYGMVRFNAAKAELDALPAGLEGENLCRAEFRRGRTVYRLRRRNDAMAHFERVVEACSEFPDQRVRALYALGDRAFDTGRMDDSRRHFEQLLSDYPERSHADDAILYLARAARASGDSERELELVRRAVADYSTGDMLHEIVWEHLEPVYRRGDMASFLTQLAALKLPDRDDQYFSQGRLEYFAARALVALNRVDEAHERYLETVQKYPFSFYGYLSVVELRKAGKTVEIEASLEPPEWVETSWYRDPEVRLLSAGLHEEAARLASASRPKSDAMKWRKAAVLHIAGRPWASHNVVRRHIRGRPWVGSSQGRLIRWHIAWPQPFADTIEAAAVAEDAQNPGQSVRPALAAAIMREESSFIEDIESYAGALGLMQLMPRTALGHDDDIDGAATPDKLKTARINVRVGTDHLHWLAKRFDGHPVLMVAAYNAGAGATGKWLRRQPNDEIALFVEDIPYLQTRNYTKRVIGSYLAYQWLNGVAADDRVVRGAK